MRKTFNYIDPVQTLKKFYKGMGSKSTPLNQFRFRLLLNVFLALHVYLLIMHIRFPWPVEIARFLIFTIWAFDAFFVATICVTGVYAVADIPAARRTKILFQALWRIYWQPPQTALASVREALTAAQQTHFENRALEIARQKTPLIRRTIERLVAEHKAGEAFLLINKADDDAKRNLRRIEELYSRARSAQCTYLIEDLLKKGKIEDAEHCIWRMTVLLADAERLGVKEETAAFVRYNGFDAAEAQLRTILQDRAKKLAHETLASRVTLAPVEKQGQLERLVKELLEIEFNSRDYRKARYHVEREIEEAIGPRE
ncbi:MAG: hypothetical protein A2677_03110 [Candidatus Komeilibacteria bacterium RIFCSPHIGHO2_01_FULL_52_14]|uniref:Uncharacterized protein n=1 Tax=Candidatus Komeilibacteria bacterium RIFCSPHIGHO2_01_FULL_52_14 TaxID=1798549 RepID=A0A1G2BNH4_9BACT|nr:MAG: hypothetical protein A2677_03110 [Candidatus Komeilibacteria bacterium RIFCSPHIGHO2_01_FULL_52_14]